MKIRDLIDAYKSIKQNKNKERCNKEIEEIEKNRENYKNHQKLINEFREKYLSEKKEEFLKNNIPLFKKDEIVVTNWYSNIHDSWENNISNLQLHTPYRGPIDVIITSDPIVDTSELSEIIMNYNEREWFNDINDIPNEYQYNKFKGILYNLLIIRSAPLPIYFAYTIKVVGDEKEYWCYTLRENKFLKKNSKIAKWSKRMYKIQLQREKLQQEKEKLDKKIELERRRLNSMIGI